MSNIFFISDTHFSWSAVMKAENRPFNSIEEMDETLIQRWNNTVSKKDTVYHLGDFAYGRVFNIKNRLNGYVHLILGNHDHLNREEKKLFVSVSDLKHLKSVPRIIMSHRPLRSWEPSKSKRIHLHGHCHGKLEKGDYNCLDISDPVWEWTPIPLERIINIFEGREISPSEIGK
jgi:calcineurin-like phosphoesterase family protein